MLFKELLTSFFTATLVKLPLDQLYSLIFLLVVFLGDFECTQIPTEAIQFLKTFCDFMILISCIRSC